MEAAEFKRKVAEVYRIAEEWVQPSGSTSAPRTDT